MQRSYRFAPAFAGLLLLCHFPAGAQELRLDEAVERALSDHPILRAQRADVAATERSAELQALAPPLTVGGELENAAGTGPLSGVQGAETTIRVSRVIELGGKRDARLALGRADVARQRHGVEVARLELAAETSRRFVEVLADQSRVLVAREAVSRAEQTLEQVERWVLAGRSPDSEKNQARIALGQAELMLEDAEHELLAARQSLSALWGERVPDFTEAVGDLDVLPDTEPLEALAQRLPETADQRAYGLDLDALEARQRAAASLARPDVSLSLGVRRLEAADAQAIVFGVSVPLGSAPQSALAGAQAQAQLDATLARREAAGHEAYQQLFALYQELQHARHVVEIHRDSLIPQAEQALAVNQRGYELGRFSFLALMQAQQQLAQLHSARIEAAARYHALRVDIDRLTATSGTITP